MRRFLFLILNTVISLFFLFGVVQNNQTFAAGNGSSCIAAVPNGGCDSGLSCYTGTCSGSNCSGICKKNCTVRFSENGSNPNGCDNSKGEVCKTLSCSGTSCSGICIPDTDPHIDKYQTCKSSSSLGGATAAQGNCVAGLVCNTAADKNCNSTSGGCTGTCFPANYTCNAKDDSRKGLEEFSCPGSFSCYEAQNKKPTQVCTTTSCGRAGCATTCTTQCVGCIFSCVPEVDIKISCTCDNLPGVSKGSGRNGFTCKNEISSQHSYCEKSEQGCYNESGAIMTKSDVFGGQTLNGIQCLTDAKKFPPAPPCNHFDANGKCDSILTSLGNFSTDPSGFISRLFGILLGVAGAIAVLLFSRAGYKIMSSRGNPEGIKEGREQLVAAIVGLMFLIFSFVILEVIGVDLLRIPNFTSSSGIQLGGTCDVNNNKCATGLVCNYNGSGGQCQKP